jgi:hypothetical protein
VIILTQPNTVELNAALPKRIKELLSKAGKLDDLQLLLNTPSHKIEKIKPIVMKKNK